MSDPYLARIRDASITVVGACPEDNTPSDVYEITVFGISVLIRRRAQWGATTDGPGLLLVEVNNGGEHEHPLPPRNHGPRSHGMICDPSYTTARQAIDPDADYVIHIRTDTGWTQPTDPGQSQLPGLDVLLAARRALRTEPAGTVRCTPARTVHIRTGDGRLWLRFVLNTVAETSLSATSI